MNNSLSRQVHWKRREKKKKKTGQIQRTNIRDLKEKVIDTPLHDWTVFKGIYRRLFSLLPVQSHLDTIYDVPFDEDGSSDFGSFTDEVWSGLCVRV